MNIGKRLAIVNEIAKQTQREWELCGGSETVF